MKHINKVILPFMALFSAGNFAVAQQPITEVYSNYGGFWSSSTSANSLTKPDSSHMLLGFTYNGTTYGTGVLESVLTANNVTYQAAQFEAFVLPADAIINTTGAVIGVGNLYGGGPENVQPLPVTNNLAQYLSDGTHGLDLGTAIFNVPSAALRYNVSNFNTLAISDAVPDIIVTQVGAPPAATSSDSFRFEDASGNIVGTAVAVSLAGIDILGTGYWKFYNPGQPPSYNAGFLGDRPLRMVGFRLTDFGLTAANIATVSRFVHKLSGNSDQAFIAYNTAAFNAGSGVVLPIQLNSFTATKSGPSVAVTWSVSNADNFSHFMLERSVDGASTFEAMARIPHTDQNNYAFVDQHPGNGQNLYRLKLVDKDGQFSYSYIQRVDFTAKNVLRLFPNPSADMLTVELATAPQLVVISDLAGRKLDLPVTFAAGKCVIATKDLPNGNYLVRIQTATGAETLQFNVRH